MRLHQTMLAVLVAAPALAQTNDPYSPINANEGVIRVDVREFAALPDIDGVATRMMLLVQEPGTRGAARAQFHAVPMPPSDRGQTPISRAND